MLRNILWVQYNKPSICRIIFSDFAVLPTDSYSAFRCLYLVDRRKSSIQRRDQLVDVILARIQHQARADHVTVEAAFADEYAAAFGLLEYFQYRLRSRLLRLAVLHEFDALH